MSDQALHEPLAEGRILLGRAELEGLRGRLHGRGERVQFVRYIGCKLAARLLVDAQLVGEAVEGLDQGTDLVRAAARLGQRRREGARGLRTEWQASRWA